MNYIIYSYRVLATNRVIVDDFFVKSLTYPNSDPFMASKNVTIRVVIIVRIFVIKQYQSP